MKKHRIFRKILISLFILIGLVIAYFAFVLIYGSVTDYQPAFKQKLEVKNDSVHMPVYDDEFTFLSWNIGYGGLGYKEDFFYDGGEKTKASKDDFEVYINGIYAFLSKKTDVDFILLQEVDRNSTRSYKTDEMEVLSHTLPNHNYSFATNYLVNYIPVPLTNPMRRVNSGIALFSRFSPDSVAQISFPGNYSWPTKIFMLDRCFIYSSFSLKNGKELIIINTHNSAFDDGELRDIQTMILKAVLLDEYAKGNYVVAGGDWNLNPPSFMPEQYMKKYKGNSEGKALEEDFLPEDWTYVYDKFVPTNRSLVDKYKPGETETNTIDFFITSPNIKVDYNKCFDEGFLYSDHNPVFMKISLIEMETDTIADDSLTIEGE